MVHLQAHVWAAVLALIYCQAAVVDGLHEPLPESLDAMIVLGQHESLPPAALKGLEARSRATPPSRRLVAEVKVAVPSCPV